MKMLFLHGLEGSPNGTKAKYLRSKFGDDRVISPAWRVSGKVADCLDEIVASAAKLPKDEELIVVGSSFGGYLATLLHERIPQIVGFVLINPSQVAGPKKELLELFSDLRSYPIQKNFGYATAVLLGNEDDICDPDITEAFFDPFSGVTRVDDDHRFSNPESLKLIGEKIEAIEHSWFIAGLSDDD